MRSVQIWEKRQLDYWRRIFAGLSFEEACRTYVLKARPPQYLGIQPIERDIFIEGRHEHYFQKAVKHFPCEDAKDRHCCSKEELIAEAARITGSSESEAHSLLYRLFAFQPELTYSNRGALCKTDFPAEKTLFDAKEIAIPYDMLKRDLPDEWYISLQIPEKIIDGMIWGCRKAGSPSALPCSGRFAERVLRLYKHRRGEFIGRYSFDTLKFFWLEYGSMDFPQKEVGIKVAELFRKMA